MNAPRPVRLLLRLVPNRRYCLLPAARCPLPARLPATVFVVQVYPSNPIIPFNHSINQSVNQPN